MSGLSADEQHVVRTAGGFFSHLAGETNEAPTGGCTAHLFDRAGWIDYDAKGIRFSYWTESDPRQLVLTVTWGALRKHATSLPSDLIDRIRDYLRRSREHQMSFMSYPNRVRDPEGWQRADRYFHDVHMPESLALSDEGKGLMDEAYPLTVAHEPTDLLELLAAMS